MKVTLNLVGSGYSSNTVKSTVTIDGKDHYWINDSGNTHTGHVVGVDGLSLDMIISEGTSIQLNGSAAHDSGNLGGTDNLKVYR